IEIVGDRNRLSANTGEVSPTLSDGLLATFIRISFDITGGHIGRDRDCLVGIVDADHRGIATWDLRGVRLDEMIILLPYPAPGAEVGRTNDLKNGCLEIIGGGNLVRAQCCRCFRLAPRPV